MTKSTGKRTYRNERHRDGRPLPRFSCSHSVFVTLPVKWPENNETIHQCVHCGAWRIQPNRFKGQPPGSWRYGDLGRAIRTVQYEKSH